MRVLVLGLGRGRLRPRSGAAGAGQAPHHLAAVPRRRLRPAALHDPGDDADRVVVVPDGPQPGRARHLQLLLEPEPLHGPGGERAEPGGCALLAHAGGSRHPLGLRRHPLHLSARADGGRARHGLRRPRAAGDRARARPRADPRGSPRPRHRPPSDGRALVGGLRRLHGAPRRARRADRRRRPPDLRARAGPRRPLRRLHELGPRGSPRLPPPRPRSPGPRPRRQRATSSSGSTKPSTAPAAS